MLVLTRKLQQQIKIGDQITVTILKVKGSTVRIGVQAPKDVRVIRGELPKNTEHATSEMDVCLELPALEAVAAATSDAEPGEIAEAPAPAPAPPAAHLPLRRLKKRHGAGPLKQMMTACATLAK